MAAIAASDKGRADAALRQRFRLGSSERERTAVFADVVRQHGDAVLGSCAERLWPDADAAIAAARDVLIDAVRAHAAPDVPAAHDSPARRASLQHWLEQIAATLPEARQRLFDLFVTRGLDSRSAARELGSNVAEVRRLRRENRQAILRAFEVTALAVVEDGRDQPGRDDLGCGDLRQLLADAHRDGDPADGAPPQITVLPAALRLTVIRHLSQCGACQARRDDYLARWAPEILPILARAELNEQVMEGAHRASGLDRFGAAPGAHRRPAPVKRPPRVGTAATAIIRQPAAAAGAGLLAALLLLAFVWPGLLDRTAALAPQAAAAPSAQQPGSSGAPQVAGTGDGAADRTSGRPVGTAAAGLLSSLPPEAAGRSAGPSMFASPTPTVPDGVQPSTPAPTARPTSGTPPTSSTPSPSASAPTRTRVPSTPTPTTSPSSTPSPAKSPAASPSPTTSPSPSPSTSSSASPSTSSSASPSTSSSASPSSTPSPAMSPSPTPSAASPSAVASSTAPQPTPTPSTPTPS